MSKMNWTKVPGTNEVSLEIPLFNNFLISNILLTPFHNLKLTVSGSNLKIQTLNIEIEKETIEKVVLTTEKQNS